MKFEKISEKEYRKFWAKRIGRIEAEEQKEERVAYFLEKMPLPTRKTGFSAGYDFTLPETVRIEAGAQIIIPTGIKVQLDEDKVLEMHIRSSYGIKKNLVVANVVGIIDSDYYNNKDNEGHILMCLWNRGKEAIIIERGQAFCQGIIKRFFLVEGDEYGKGAERVGGTGSTDVDVDVTEAPKADVKPEKSDVANHASGQGKRVDKKHNNK